MPSLMDFFTQANGFFTIWYEPVVYWAWNYTFTRRGIGETYLGQL